MANLPLLANFGEKIPSWWNSRNEWNQSNRINRIYCMRKRANSTYVTKFFPPNVVRRTPRTHRQAVLYVHFTEIQIESPSHRSLKSVIFFYPGTLKRSFWPLKHNYKTYSTLHNRRVDWRTISQHILKLLVTCSIPYTYLLNSKKHSYQFYTTQRYPSWRFKPFP